MTSFFNILAETAATATVEPTGIVAFLTRSIPAAFVALPILGALWLVLQPKIADKAARVSGLVFSFSTLFLCALTGIIAATSDTAVQFSTRSQSSGPLNVSFDLTLHGISLLMVLLTGIITPMALAASWKVARPRLFNILFLLMQSAALGVFLAQNFFFWFLFWELSLFPAFFLIKLWGGHSASRAAYQFVIYTIGGSAFMLLAFAAIYATTGTWDFTKLAWHLGSGGDAYGKIGATGTTLIFLGIFIGLAVKIPIFPFHTWLPDAYAEAPIGASMFLTAVMAKMGLYGFYIFLASLLPHEMAKAAHWLVWLALANIVFGAYAAMRQRDLKRMVAYSSVNHLGYCVLAFAVIRTRWIETTIFSHTDGEELTALTRGISAASDGAWLQMFNHGLSAAALFFCVGVLESRSGVRGLQDFGGVRKVAPLFAALCGFSMFSSLGLPGLNGFVGEFLIFRGVFAHLPWAAAIATLGLLGTAIFLLTFWQKVFHGPAGAHTGAITDLSKREIAALAPIVALMVLFGVWPQLLLDILKSLP
ncbi:MAG: NADH-quinone oxidoreductase subunit M [Puniceicoccales bacterium]|jgi:NADH-quinone oxidoreductase subunit M|nr:NADH-quinone oxidoreductase subunit M [Puniceicoccales bacterium]